MILRFFFIFAFYVFRSIPKRLNFMFRLFKSQDYDFIFLYTIPGGRRLERFAFFVCWQFIREFLHYCFFSF